MSSPVNRSKPPPPPSTALQSGGIPHLAPFPPGKSNLTGDNMHMTHTGAEANGFHGTIGWASHRAGCQRATGVGRKRPRHLNTTLRSGGFTTGSYCYVQPPIFVYRWRWSSHTHTGTVSSLWWLNPHLLMLLKVPHIDLLSYYSSGPRSSLTRLRISFPLRC